MKKLLLKVLGDAEESQRQSASGHSSREMMPVA
jgi:hypothetical protein